MVTLLSLLHQEPHFFLLNSFALITHPCECLPQLWSSDRLQRPPDLTAGDSELIVRENIYSQFKINWDAFVGPPLEL